MIEHAWTVLCQKVITDPHSQNITMVEATEQVNLVGPIEFPSLAAMHLELVSLWYRSTHDIAAHGEARLTLWGPNGNEIAPPQSIALDLTVFHRARTIAQLPGLPVAGRGRHSFKLEMRLDGQAQWKEVARLPVQVEVFSDQTAFQQNAIAARDRARSNNG